MKPQQPPVKTGQVLIPSDGLEDESAGAHGSASCVVPSLSSLGQERFIVASCQLSAFSRQEMMAARNETRTVAHGECRWPKPSRSTMSANASSRAAGASVLREIDLADEPPASSSRSSDPAAAANRPCSASSPGWISPPAARSAWATQVVPLRSALRGGLPGAAPLPLEDGSAPTSRSARAPEPIDPETGSGSSAWPGSARVIRTSSPAAWRSGPPWRAP